MKKILITLTYVIFTYAIKAQCTTTFLDLQSIQNKAVAQKENALIAFGYVFIRENTLLGSQYRHYARCKDANGHFTEVITWTVLSNMLTYSSSVKSNVATIENMVKHLNCHTAKQGDQDVYICPTRTFKFVARTDGWWAVAIKN